MVGATDGRDVGLGVDFPGRYVGSNVGSAVGSTVGDLDGEYVGFEAL